MYYVNIAINNILRVQFKEETGVNNALHGVLLPYVIRSKSILSTRRALCFLLQCGRACGYESCTPAVPGIIKNWRKPLMRSDPHNVVEVAEYRSRHSFLVQHRHCMGGTVTMLGPFS